MGTYITAHWRVLAAPFHTLQQSSETKRFIWHGHHRDGSPEAPAWRRRWHHRPRRRRRGRHQLRPLGDGDRLLRRHPRLPLRRSRGTGAAHLLVLPLEVLWRSLVTVVTAAAGAVASGLDGLWQHVAGFFAHIPAVIAGAVHLLVLSLETLWQWLATSMADAAGAVASGFDGLWQHVVGFFAHISAVIAGAAHQLVLPLETLWKWLGTSMADAAGAISSGVDGLWQLIAGFLPGAWAAVAGAAHQIPQKLEELWRWLQAAAPVALPYVLGVAAVVLVAALVWFCWPILLGASMGVAQALVTAACYFVQGLLYVGGAVQSVFVFLLPCLNQCAVVNMKAPGAAGMLISRAAFEAAPELFFQIMRAAPPIVAATVFCTETVASLVAAPVAALFGAR